MRSPTLAAALAAVLGVSSFAIPAFAENVKAAVTMTDTGATLTAKEAEALIGKPLL